MTINVLKYINNKMEFIKNTDEETGDVTYTFNTAISKDLMETLCDITNNEDFYNDQCEVSAQYLYSFHNEMQRRVESGNNITLMTLVIDLSEQFANKIKQFEKMNEDGKVTFDNLKNIFKPMDKFTAKDHNGFMIGSHIVDASFVMLGPGVRGFQITGNITKSNGKNFVQTPEKFYIMQYPGLRRVDDLEVKPMTDENLIKLTERGRIFREHGLGCHFKEYNGEMFKMGMYGPVYFDSTGRIMIDPIGYKNYNPNSNRRLFNIGNNHYGNDSNDAICESIPDDLLFMTSPTFLGFSFKEKMWGEFMVDQVTQIKFDDDAIDSLVLDEDLKELLTAVVTESDVGFTDIIHNKSGGCIIMLQGKPGIGKTLTCEVMAEKLRRPLYSVTVGELGTTPESLEKKLASIQELVESWNAVLLLDEADILLERRVDGDITRNAMAGILLRLLEKYNGIMFLTTNRMSSIDNAFKSRISINIVYEELGRESRLKVWKNILKAANMTYLSDEDIDSLSHININGRQIKNSIRMIQKVNKHKNKQCTLEEIKNLIKVAIPDLSDEEL